MRGAVPARPRRRARHRPWPDRRLGVQRRRRAGLAARTGRPAGRVRPRPVRQPVQRRPGRGEHVRRRRPHRPARLGTVHADVHPGGAGQLGQRAPLRQPDQLRRLRRQRGGRGRRTTVPDLAGQRRPGRAAAAFAGVRPGAGGGQGTDAASPGPGCRPRLELSVASAKARGRCWPGDMGGNWIFLLATLPSMVPAARWSGGGTKGCGDERRRPGVGVVCVIHRGKTSLAP